MTLKLYSIAIFDRDICLHPELSDKASLSDIAIARQARRFWTPRLTTSADLPARLAP